MVASNLEFKTLNDLITEVLADLGVLSSGQPVDPEDYNYVNNLYDPILRKTEALEIVALSSYDVTAIPGAWFKDLVSIVAGECASKFGYTGQELSDKRDQGLGGGQLDAGMGIAAKALKTISRLKPTGEVLRADYF